MSRSFTARITQTPRLFDAAPGQDAAALYPQMPPEMRALIAGAASTSPYLAGLLRKEAPWLDAAIADPEAASNAVTVAAAAVEGDGVQTHLRQAKRRIALICALADLGGAWSLEEVTTTLTAFADAACAAALRAGLAPLLARGKIPGMTEADLEDAAGVVLLAMGKLGAAELNYSSDIDLICLFDETRFEPDQYQDARAGFVRAVRRMSAHLSEITAEGYVFRTDLRLRPDAAVTPVCISMEVAERYYESQGRTWERAAFIKARPSAGDIAAGARFIRALRPFVWRKHLDFAAIQDAHDMRLAIREHKRLFGPITLPGHNMKLGRGGIREIEFYTQTRQLISGGRDPDLRRSGTVEGLQALAAKGWIDAEVAQRLGGHYRWHRCIEHRLQMMRDAQTHDLPRSDREFARLAAMLDMDVTPLQKELRARLSDVHEVTEGFFDQRRTVQPAETTSNHVFDPAILRRWLSYPALRSERGAALFEKLKPDLLACLSQAAKPEEALMAFDGFLRGLPAGVQLFSLLQANPSLADLLIDVVRTSPALGQYLSRNAGVLDAVIGGPFFAEWPGQAALSADLLALLKDEPSYEAQLDVTRRWAKERHFRIGVHFLRGLISPATAGRHYADLARAILAALWPIVIGAFAKRYGPPPGRGAVLLGMGSLGAGRLTSTSDLDLLVIYDPQGVEHSSGPRSLATRLYYARLTQAMITAMTAPMAEGKLYEIDMRLRPSGNQGPVATSLKSFDLYQMTEAWTWEHLALTRAAVVAGPADLSADVTRLCQRVLARPSPRAEVLRDVADMRRRLAAAKAPVGIWDAKTGAGRLQDIELLAQTGALLAGIPAPEVRAGIEAAVQVDLITATEGGKLTEAYETLWALQSASRLLSPAPLPEDEIGTAAADFLARTLESDGLAPLASQIAATYDQTRAIIARALAAGGPDV